MSRPPMRPEQGNIRENQVKRRVRSGDDRFQIPAHLKQPGTSYEWKTEEVIGASDPAYMSGLIENGWENVQLSEMPYFGREGESGAVRRGGQVLMKRPIELTKEARQEDFQIARQQVSNNTAKMTGTNPAAGMPISSSSRVGVKYDLPSADEDVGIRRTATSGMTHAEMRMDD
jgi:hypothetical protein